jgi:hypothetical protein
MASVLCWIFVMAFLLHSQSPCNCPSCNLSFYYWTVRDFYTLGEEFTYVALVQKADKKSKRLKFDIWNLSRLSPFTLWYTLSLSLARPTLCPLFQAGSKKTLNIIIYYNTCTVIRPAALETGVALKRLKQHCYNILYIYI